jgi:capsular exopolysaccharide synthesis family protein
LRSLRCPVLQVTSALPGDGKTTLASNLAISLAQANKRVLLIDADLRRPRLHVIFDAQREAGLSCVLSGEKSLGEAILATNVRGVDVIPCGFVPPNPAELLDSDNFQEMLTSARERYDYVLLDTPAVLAAADASIVASRADCVLLVIGNSRDGRPAALQARETVKSVGAQILGVVLNAMQPAQHEYCRYGYYGRPHTNGSTSDKNISKTSDENGRAKVSRSQAEVVPKDGTAQNESH